MTLRKEDIATINALVDQEQDRHADKAEIFDRYKKIIETSAKWMVDGNQETSFEQLADRLIAQPEVTIISRQKIWWVAASITLILTFASLFLHYNQEVNIQVPMAEMKTIWLPDSSKVILNAGAELTYSKEKWKNNERLVDLHGLAYFEVKKGSDFVVGTRYGTVAVLGTSFNVNAATHEFAVECFTGKVAVQIRDQKEKTLLQPGFKVRMESKSQPLVRTRFKKKQARDWINGNFSFHNQPLQQVWAEFERQYNVEINFDQNTERFYSGAFTNSDMENALSAICKPMGLTYEINDSKQIITINN